MNCTLFPHHLFSHCFTNSSTNRYPVFEIKQRWLNSSCCAVGFPGAGAGSLSEDNSLNQNEIESLFGTFDAEITSETIDFFVSDADGDPDCPSEGYSSIEQALNTLRKGKFVIVVDDESKDVEGNLIMAASMTNPRDIAFLIKHGSGIVSVGMKEDDLERLKLPLMSPETEDEDSSAPTFTITVVIYN